MLRCSPKAFAKCQTRHICGKIEEATFTEGSECDRFNQSVADMPMTNADRIRDMTDEELVELAIKQIGGGFDWMPCGVVCGGKCTTTRSEECRKRILHWLQQPAQEER